VEHGGFAGIARVDAVGGEVAPDALAGKAAAELAAGEQPVLAVGRICRALSCWARTSRLASATMSWLPDDFAHPVYVPVPGTALHLRPIREADTALDYPAVMGSRKRLWEIFGQAWGWPPETMTFDEDRIDLLRHEKEIAAHQSFNYALMDDEETAILGCVYIDPPERTGCDAEVCWWVVDDLVGGEVERALDASVPQWVAAEWPFQHPRYLARDITWQEWLALPRAS
jgi:hypothetical protein